MEQFISVTGLAAPLLRANIDTDLLIPSREMTTPDRAGSGEKLLAPWRYLSGQTGARVENPDFILNREPFRHATILISGANFGSGSSREAAVWALRDFGFRSVLAPSFGTIFRNNCYRNGILPVVLSDSDVETLATKASDGALNLTVDLERCTVVGPDDHLYPFTLPVPERRMLLEGLDAIGVTLKRQQEIDSFQAADRLKRPWIWARPDEA